MCVWTFVYTGTWSCELPGPLHRGILPEQLCAEMLQRLGESWSLFCTSPHAPAQAAGSSSWEAALCKRLRVYCEPALVGACVSRALPAGQSLLCKAVSTSGLLSLRCGYSPGSLAKGHHNHQVFGILVDEERLSKLGLYSIDKRRFWGLFQGGRLTPLRDSQWQGKG